MDYRMVYLEVVVFVATTIRSAFGFGEALLAVPLLALCMPLSIATPLAVMISVTIALIVVIQDWRQIHVRSAGWLLAGTLLGLPLGLAGLSSSHQHIIKALLAILILAFSTYGLVGRTPPELKTESFIWVLGCGYLAGVLGGAFGMNGPPLVIYGAMRRWSAQHFRATLQGYFLPASLLGLAGYWAQGLWVPEVTHDFLMTLPATLTAIWVGRKVNQRLHSAAFLRYVYGLLAGIGALLLIRAWP